MGVKDYPASLHNHTMYSNLRLRDCISRPEELIDYAIELGHKGIAITDHECVSNAIKVEQYYTKIKKTNPNFKVIRGNEIYLVRNGLNANNFNKEKDRYYHFILLAKDLIGMKQIFEISTRAWQRSYLTGRMRRVPTYYQDLVDIIGKNPGHVIGSTACLGGALPTQILRGTDDEILDAWINQMVDIFGEEDFYFEMQPSNNKEQIIVNKKLLEFSKKHNIPYIITTDSHYLKKEDRAIHKAYLNAQDGDREVDEFYTTTYLMGTEELESFFSYFDEETIKTSYQTIEEIMDKCEDFTLTKPLKIPELIWRPSEYVSTEEKDLYIQKMPTLEKFLTSKYKSDNYLVGAVINGIKKHEDLQNEEAYAALEDNLQRTWESSEVNKARWSAYYLNLQKTIDECWNAGTIVGPSRGSGGGFLLLYCLDIIQLNCLKEKTPTFPWRFLNPKRESVLDIDTDIEGSRRKQVIAHLHKVYGDNRVANVATFKTEKSKSAILTAARGLGIDVDIAQYIASLIPADRGQLRTLNECMYGNEEKGFQPIKQFVFEMTENYPELWEVAQRVEGLICGSGLHAGGIIFVDEPFTESTALMRAPDGTICTQFELHDAEAVSLIKIDLLSVEAMDKIHTCIDLLCEYGYAEKKETLRETYDSIIGIYNIDRQNSKMWDMLNNHKINSLFQMEKQSGINGIELAKPRSVDELAVLNSVIRLMAIEKGAEQPLDMWARYRKDITEWYNEMRRYGLNQEQINWLANSSAITDGICEAQEGLMALLQDEKLGGNDLSFADKCRKAIAKKQGKLFEECEKEFFENAEQKGCDKMLVHYVWDVLLRVQRGYSFCRAHTLAYSLVALQEMELACHYPIIFWNTACLITDAGGTGEGNDEEEENKEELTYYNEMEEFTEEDNEDDVVNEYDEEDCDGYPVTVKVMKNGKKKKKPRKVNYGKIATAIGKMQSSGIEIYHPDINASEYTFSPDVVENRIYYGINGINKIGEEVVQLILKNRPYTSLEDLISKVKMTKPQIINLIKSGACDEFGDRMELMKNYIESICDKKQTLNLRNMQMLCKYDLIPDELTFNKRVFNFNKYLSNQKSGTNYILNEPSLEFYQKYFDMDNVKQVNGNFVIAQNTWKKIYNKQMDPVRDYIKKNLDELLTTVNTTLFNEMWNKYCLGNYSKWEMESISFYFNEHELKNLNTTKIGVDDFNLLPEQPTVEKTFPTKDGKIIQMFEINRVAGTVLDRDKNKKTITLLTTSGVVTVKLYGTVFSYYDKQISEKGEDGKKHVIEKSFFTKGNKIIVTGIKRENLFIAKKYKSTPYHLVELITNIDSNGNIETRAKRIGDEEE